MNAVLFQLSSTHTSWLETCNCEFSQHVARVALLSTQCLHIAARTAHKELLTDYGIACEPISSPVSSCRQRHPGGAPTCALAQPFRTKHRTSATFVTAANNTIKMHWQHTMVPVWPACCGGSYWYFRKDEQKYSCQEHGSDVAWPRYKFTHCRLLLSIGSWFRA